MTEQLLNEGMFAPSTSSFDYQTPNSLPPFYFDSGLDSSFLEDFYQGDLQQASFMFEVFLNFTVPNFNEMLHAARFENWDNVYELAHKAKPSFEIVGLTRMAECLGEIERHFYDPAELEQVINDLRIDFQQILPTVVSQKMSIDDFLQSWSN